MAHAGCLHHIEIYVRDLSISREFWSWFLEDLGYSLYQEWNGGFSYLLGETYLVFVQAEERFLHGESYHRCKPGLNHLAFYVRDEAEVAAWTEKVMAKGLKVLYADRHPYAGGSGYCALFFEDPDRMKVELVAAEGVQ